MFQFGVECIKTDPQHIDDNINSGGDDLTNNEDDGTDYEDADENNDGDEDGDTGVDDTLHNRNAHRDLLRRPPGLKPVTPPLSCTYTRLIVIFF